MLSLQYLQITVDPTMASYVLIETATAIKQQWAQAASSYSSVNCPNVLSYEEENFHIDSNVHCMAVHPLCGAFEAAKINPN